MDKVKTISINLIEDNHTQKIIFRALLGCLLVLMVAYCYFIGNITFNILARKSFENNIQVVTTKISQLELDYLKKMSLIDKDYAINNGFIESEDSIFALRTLNEVAIR